MSDPGHNPSGQCPVAARIEKALDRRICAILLRERECRQFRGAVLTTTGVFILSLAALVALAYWTGGIDQLRTAIPGLGGITDYYLHQLQDTAQSIPAIGAILAMTLLAVGILILAPFLRRLRRS